MPMTTAIDLMDHPDAVARPPGSRRGSQSAANVLLDSLIGLLAILPLLLTAHVPLTDLPNHLARQYILRDWASSPFLQSFYDIHWVLVPNLALELFVLVARHVISIDMAMRAFCIGTVVMLFVGTRLLNRELSRGHARVYRVAPLLCYGGPFQYGFLSYCFGIGLALILCGVYVRLRARSSEVAATSDLNLPLKQQAPDPGGYNPKPSGSGQRPTALLVTFLLICSFALLLCHLAAFGLFAIAVATCELIHGHAAAAGAIRRLPRELLKREAIPLCGLVPMFLVFLWLSPTAGAVTDGVVRFASLHEKARAFASITFFTSPRLEVALLALAVAGLAIAVASGAIRVHRVALAIVTIMLTVWLLLPGIAMGAAFIDYRLPWAIAFFLLAGLMPGRRYRRWSAPLAGFFGSLVLARITLIAVLWLTWEPTLAAIDRALTILPLGARMMVIEGRPPGGGVFRQPDLANVASYAVARRQAFEPTLFASLPGQVLYFQPHYLQLWQQGDFAVEIPSSLDQLAPDYDHVLVLLPALARISPRLALICQAAGRDFALFKVAPSGVPLAEANRRVSCSAE